MCPMHRNYIAGEWLEGSTTRRNLNRWTPRTSSASTLTPTPRNRHGDRSRARCISRLEQGVDRPLDALDRIGGELLARMSSATCFHARKARPCQAMGEVARAGKSFASSPARCCARAANICRQCARASSGHHARGRRRGGNHHAVELSDCNSRLEDRPGACVRQFRGVQAGRPGARVGLGVPKASEMARGEIRAGSSLAMTRSSASVGLSSF